MPNNGLVLYTGTILTEDGKEKKVNIDFEPFKTINTSLYLCDNKFHTEALSELLESENKYGFIVMDGNGTLFGTLSGNAREVSAMGTSEAPRRVHRRTSNASRSHVRAISIRANHRTALALAAFRLFADSPQVHRRPSQEARQRRAVRAAFRASAHGEAPQLRPQGTAASQPLQRAASVACAQPRRCRVVIPGAQAR